ncbi:MAG: ArnT family glycosyltransferase [Candidatus Micrarchaeia archaeon]
MKITERKDKRGMLFLLLILIVASVVYYSTAALPQPSNDDIEYMSMAYFTSYGGPLLYNTFPFSVSYGIVLPLTLFYRIFGFSMFTGIYYEIALTLVAVALVYKVANQYSKYAGVLSALIFAFIPAIIGVSNAIVPDVFVLVMALASVAALQAALHRKGSREYYMLAGLLAFLSTFGNILGYIFLLLLFIYIIFNYLKTKSAKLFGYAMLGIAMGFLISMLIGWYTSNGLYLPSGEVKYPYLISTYYLFRFYAPTYNNPPSPFSIAPLSLIYGMFFLPTKYLFRKFTIQFVWPYAYGSLAYMVIFSLIYSIRNKTVRKYEWLLLWAAGVFIIQLFAIKQGFFEYSRFELLLIAPLAIFCGVVLSDYLVSLECKSPARKEHRKSMKLTLYTALTILLFLNLYFGALYSVKNIYTTNILYNGIDNISSELSTLPENPYIYIAYHMPPTTSGRLDIMFYSSMYGVNISRFRPFSGNCSTVMPGSYLILPITNTTPYPLQTCSSVLIYKTQLSENMTYGYALFRTQ